ncbi:MAG: hypothetical protein Q7U60_07150, partial [Candidatus Methanoperedens sp.]|nr:hypothetical protein [Candidatus Methanoperedens sp.]
MPVYPGIYILFALSGSGEKNQCQTKEGIIFAAHNKWDGIESSIDEGTEEKPKVSTYENYA